jgi:hypothetical protein
MLDIKPAINGEVYEFGVYQGITFRRLCRNYPKQTVVGFDSFEGLPEYWDGNGGMEAGHFKTRVPPRPSNGRYVIGSFSFTVPGFFREVHPLTVASFVHIDCDLYSSAFIALINLRPYLVKGSLILFDEFFGNKNWLTTGEAKALYNSGINCEPTHICETGQQVLFRCL